MPLAGRHHSTRWLADRVQLALDSEREGRGARLLRIILGGRLIVSFAIARRAGRLDQVIHREPDPSLTLFMADERASLRSSTLSSPRVSLFCRPQGGALARPRSRLDGDKKTVKPDPVRARASPLSRPPSRSSPCCIKSTTADQRTEQCAREAARLVIELLMKQHASALKRWPRDATSVPCKVMHTRQVSVRRQTLEARSPSLPPPPQL